MIFTPGNLVAGNTAAYSIHDKLMEQNKDVDVQSSNTLTENQGAARDLQKLSVVINAANDKVAASVVIFKIRTFGTLPQQGIFMHNN